MSPAPAEENPAGNAWEGLPRACAWPPRPSQGPARLITREEIQSWIVHEDERLLVICHHGMRSLNVTVWMRNQGFEQAQSVRGGIEAWSREVDPTLARY